SIMKDIYPLNTTDAKEKVKVSDDESIYIKEKCYEKHYLNMLAFLDHFFMPNEIKLIHYENDHLINTDAVVNVSLVLDVGNSRTLGLLVEEDNNQYSSSDAFPNSNPLLLRDLNAPENYYCGPFESRIEFQKANFEYGFWSSRSGNLDAFCWPSIVRVGPEASRLASMSSGTEGDTGLTSPKRYLWRLSDPVKTEWKFNNCSYQIPCYTADEDTDGFKMTYQIIQNEVKSATYNVVSRFINSSGDAFFACTTGDDSVLKSNYTGKSTMTFMLMEIILQAMMQMNSFYYRRTMANRDLPRRLNSLVLTTPPSMPDVEREIFRSCAYQAIGILWKALGYDKTPKDEFHFLTKKDEMFPRAPEVFLKWDETISSQLVYLYNETQRVYNGNCKQFIKELRRSSADGRFNEYCRPYLDGRKTALVSNNSARIASIDIGGGTTDLVIADYSCPDRLYHNKESLKEDKNFTELGDQQSSIMIREILKDGFKIAGDDLLLDIIRQKIAPQFKVDLSKIVGTKLKDNAIIKKQRVLTAEQIFTRIAYRVLERIESLDTLPHDGNIEIFTKGSVYDFLTHRDRCSVESLNKNNAPEKIKDEAFPVDDSVRTYLNDTYGSEDVILKQELFFNLYEINYELSRGKKYDLTNSCLKNLNAIVNAYHCDVLLLTGRPSKLPGLRKLIERTSTLSPYRIISMHNYRCDDWYPAFENKTSGIDDPKSAVVVGALLGYIKMRSNSRLINFRLDSKALPASDPMRFLGVLDNDNKISRNEVLYSFKTDSEEKYAKEREAYSDTLELNALFTDSKYTKLHISRITENLNNIVDEDVRRGTKFFEHKLPVNIGYRQFNDEKYGCTMEYELNFRELDDLREVKNTHALVLPNEIEFTEEFLDKMRKDGLIARLNGKRDVIAQIEQRFLDDMKKVEAELNNPHEEIEAPFKEQAQIAYDNAASAVKVGGLSKMLGKGDKQKSEAGKQAYDAYMSQYQMEIARRKQDAVNQELRRIKVSFQRYVTEEIIDKLIYDVRSEAKRNYDLIKNSKDTTFSLRFMITNISEDGSDDNIITRAIKFVFDEYEHQKEDGLNHESPEPPVLLALVPNTVKVYGNPSLNGIEIADYLNLRLKTTSSRDENYWNNTGLLID
ncbi:MAG: virulence factor SrfB, partial [Succinivibrio sp.]